MDHLLCFGFDLDAVASFAMHIRTLSAGLAFRNSFDPFPIRMEAVRTSRCTRA